MPLQILKWSSAIKTDTGLAHTCMYNCQLHTYCRTYIANIQCTSYTAVNINISCPHMPPYSCPHKFTYYFCRLCQPPTHTWYMYMLQYKVKQDVCGHMIYGNNIMWLVQMWLRSQAPPILLLLFGSQSIKAKNWQEMGSIFMWMTTLTVGKEPLREESTVTVACYNKFVVYNIQVFWCLTGKGFQLCPTEKNIFTESSCQSVNW